MTDKERLENMTALGVDGQGNVLIKGEDFHWLIEQNKGLQEENERLREAMLKAIDYSNAGRHTDVNDSHIAKILKNALEGELK